MESQKKTIGSLSLIQDSFSSLKKQSTVFLPFVIIIFIQLLILEILYFLPRTPIIKISGALIQKVWGEAFLHYPANFMFIDVAFNYVQIFLFIVINCLLIGSAMIAVSQEKLSFKKSFWESLKRYVHLVVAGIIFFGVFFLIYKLYIVANGRALKIQSTTGIFYFIKSIIIFGAPYFNLLIGVFVTAALGFLLPEIVLNKKNVFSALISNFTKMGFSGFLCCFTLVLLPTLFYVPMIIVKTNLGAIVKATWPGMSLLITITSVILMGLIDAVVYTSLTKYYLSRK